MDSLAGNNHMRESHSSQMNVKLKTCDILTWKKHLPLYITSTNIDAKYLSQCVKPAL
jgi:hypothetical protein